MNVLFVTSAAPKTGPFFTDEKKPPLGLGFLISILRDQGHNVFFIDNYLKSTNFIEDGFLQKNQIELVGIYANTICYQDTLRIFNALEMLRKRGLWTGKIVVGGPHTSVALNTIPEFVDYVVQGEGERAIVKIINGTALQRVLKEEPMKDLNSLPFQPWDIFSKLPYDYSCPWMDAKPVFTMNTSRGCPFNCAFCSVDSIWGSQYTYFSADRIISEIEFLIKQFGAKGIYFREDNFTLNQQRVTDFCKKLVDKSITIHWACETRVTTLCNEELVKLMGQAGCKAVYLGVESGSQRVLNLLNKGIAVEQIERAVLLCKKHGIRTYCSLITGVPGETYEDYLASKKLMRKLRPYDYTFSVFVGIPYSRLYKELLTNHAYEYIDELGLLYMPGYDIKVKYFYGLDSKNLVNHKFELRTAFDERLLNEQDKTHLKQVFTGVVSILPYSVIRKMRKSIRLKRLYKKFFFA
jgi:radical SAM superfamily enzyme YgiQ (UPF0313 family)